MARGAGVGAERWEKMCELRDLLAPGERIGWWVVWNGDVERGFPREVGGAGVEESGEGEERVGEGDIGEDGGAAGGGGQAGEGMREEVSFFFLSFFKTLHFERFTEFFFFFSADVLALYPRNNPREREPCARCLVGKAEKVLFQLIVWCVCATKKQLL